MPTDGAENQEWKHSFPQPFCLLSRFREKLSLEGQPRNQRALAGLCQGLCSECRRPFVSLQRDLCVSCLERELIPLATSDLTTGRKPAARSLRVSIRKLTGLVGRKGGCSFNLRKSHSRPSGSGEVAAGANHTLVGPTSTQNVLLSLALLGYVRC